MLGLTYLIDFYQLVIDLDVDTPSFNDSYDAIDIDRYQNIIDKVLIA